MSLLIVDIRHTTNALDTQTENIDTGHLNINLDVISRMHTVIVTNGQEFKILKDRSGHLQEGKVFPMKSLIFFIYRYQSDQLEFGSVDANDWILELTRFLDSDQLRQMSIKMEKLAFEKT
jgi:hypothetical protein